MINLNELAHQQDDENLEITLKQHWMIPVQISIACLMLFAVPFIAYGFIGYFFAPLLESPAMQAAFLVILSCYALLAMLYLLQTYLDYYLDTWIVTNKRIISAERESLFHYTISELRLYQIQDVAAEIKGFFPSILGYGKVVVQTAGEVSEFTFLNIPNAQAAAQRIISLTDADRKLHVEALTKIGEVEKENPITKKRI
ncbi:MAG: PH domain-containing protein [bacterium]